MRSRRAATISGHPRGVPRSDVAAMRDAVGYQFAVEAVEVAARPRLVVFIWKVDTAVIPGIAVSIEATSRLDRNQR